MTEHDNQAPAFESLEQEGRLIRTARMLQEDQTLRPNQRTDIIERCRNLIETTDYTQAKIARELGISNSTISELLKDRWKGPSGDRHLARLHNWMELTARRDSILASKTCVDTTVAREIITVARIVAETCQMGVVFGPARIGKTITLKAIEGDQSFGDPVLITVDESTVRPFALCRRICERFDLGTNTTFDRVFHRLIERLIGTKRMLMFDEADFADYHALEMIRQLHDQTGCPILLAGKPKIYERLGFRSMGEFSEVTDQLAGRIVIKRDLTERTRGKNPEPLYTKEDIRKLIAQTGLKLHVSPDAEKWLQARACTLAMGGIGKALVSLYLAVKVAYTKGDSTITAQHLEDVDALTIGHEDAVRIMEVVAEASGMRRVV